MSKRPLCLLVVIYAVILFLLQIMTGKPWSYPGLTDGVLPAETGTIRLTGQLYKKETKNDHQIYYLSNIQIISDSKDSKENSETKENISAMCYMDSRAMPETENRVTGTSAPEIPVGRWLLVRGERMPFEQAENEGQFDAKAYYDSLGIGVCLWNVQVLQQGSKLDFFANALVDIKQRVSKRYHAHMKPQNAGVLCAMLLGDKTSLDEDIKKLYQKSGIAHVLAISGLHISLLGMLLYRFLRRCMIPPAVCSVVGICAVMVYIKLTGASVSSVRAVSMFVLYMLADLLARTYDLLTALACSALPVFLSDASAIFEAGFLLSYLAVLGLALLLPVLKQGMEQGILNKFLQIFLPGYAVQILIFPVILWFYFEFPLYSFLLNLIVVPCMSVVLVSGMLGALPGLSQALYLTEFLLEAYEWFCRAEQQLPWAVIVTGRPKVWQVVIYYVLIIVWYVWGRRYSGQCVAWDVVRGVGVGQDSVKRVRASSRRFLYFFAPLVCMCIFLLPVHRENRVDVLSVGQGDCICMRDASGHVVLVDGGSTDVSDAGEYRLIPFLKYNGITKVDAVFLSHAHTDHYSAIVELLENGYEQGVTVKTLCLPGRAEILLEQGGEHEALRAEAEAENDSEIGAAAVYTQLIAIARRNGCKVVFVDPGDQIKCGQMRFDCLYPPSGLTVADENAASVVLLAQLGDFSVLFTGDSPASCDETVIRCVSKLGVRNIDCLKVAHHGAETSTSPELLKAFDFKVAVISSGEGNSYGHPHASLLNRLSDAGCHVFVTAKSGQITIRPGRKGKIRVSEYRKDG